jgi:hypothetical protein
MPDALAAEQNFLNAVLPWEQILRSNRDKELVAEGSLPSIFSKHLVHC